MGRPAGPLHELQAQEGACAEFLANEGAMAGEVEKQRNGIPVAVVAQQFLANEGALVGEVEKQRNGIPVAVVAQHAAWCHGGVRERH